MRCLYFFFFFSTSGYIFGLSFASHFFYQLNNNWACILYKKYTFPPIVSTLSQAPPQNPTCSYNCALPLSLTQLFFPLFYPASFLSKLASFSTTFFFLFILVLFYSIIIIIIFFSPHSFFPKKKTNSLCSYYILYMFFFSFSFSF